jgi:hypothetical protein
MNIAIHHLICMIVVSVPRQLKQYGSYMFPTMNLEVPDKKQITYTLFVRTKLNIVISATSGSGHKTVSI